MSGPEKQPKPLWYCVWSLLAVWALACGGAAHPVAQPQRADGATALAVLAFPGPAGGPSLPGEPMSAREAQIRQNLSAALVREAAYAAAWDHLSALAGAGHDSWALHLNIAQVCLYWRLDYDCVDHHAQRALQLRPDNPRAFLLLGQSAQDTAQVERAIDYYRRGLELRASESAISIQLASLLARQGDREGARAVLDEALRVSPRNGRVMLHLAALIEPTDPEQAEALYLSAALYHEEPAVGYRHLMRFYQRQGRLREAERIQEEIDRIVGRRQLRPL